MATTTSVRGVTAEERQAKRAQRTCDNRAAYYVALMTAATTPTERMRHACEYARAVAKAKTGDEIDEMAREITRVADERNKP